MLPFSDSNFTVLEPALPTVRESTPLRQYCDHRRTFVDRNDAATHVLSGSPPSTSLTSDLSSFFITYQGYLQLRQSPGCSTMRNSEGVRNCQRIRASRSSVKYSPLASLRCRSLAVTILKNLSRLPLDSLRFHRGGINRDFEDKTFVGTFQTHSIHGPKENIDGDRRRGPSPAAQVVFRPVNMTSVHYRPTASSCGPCRQPLVAINAASSLSS